jgi:hypothetical protein
MKVRNGTAGIVLPNMDAWATCQAGYRIVFYTTSA